MKVEIQIPDEGLITSVKLGDEEITLNPPVEVKKGDKVIDLTGVRQQMEERLVNQRDRDFIETP